MKGLALLARYDR